MDLPSVTTTVNGLVLGWSVAWPPGPINAEMIRRAVLPLKEGGGFWTAWQLVSFSIASYIRQDSW